MSATRDHDTAGSALPVLKDAQVKIEPAAVRMLPELAKAVGVAISGGVLHVVTDGIPTPAEFRQLEKLSGLAVTVETTTREIFEVLLERAKAALPQAAPRITGSVLMEAADAEADDVLLRVGDTPRWRVGGELVAASKFPVLAPSDLHDAQLWLLGERARSTVEYAGSRWRVTQLRAGGHPSLTLHRLAGRPPKLEDLALPAPVLDTARHSSGLVVIAGGRGSGKTTTAAALVDRINATQAKHIVCVEAPGEYVHRPLSSAISHLEVGEDVPSLAEGVQAAVDIGADVIVVSDCADRQTMAAVLSAADAGQLVIVTLAASDTAAVLSRLLGSVPDTDAPRVRGQLARSLLLVLAQQLLPALAGGRQAACEVLLGTRGAKQLIRDGRLNEVEALLENDTASGMTSMNRSLAYYAAAGRLADDVARAAAPNAHRFDEHLHRAPGRAAASAAGAQEAGQPAQTRAERRNRRAKPEPASSRDAAPSTRHRPATGRVPGARDNSED